MSILNTHILSTYYPIFAQLEHLCAKLFHVDCNDAHRWKGIQKIAHDKKRTFTTSINDQNNVERTIGMLGRHLQKFAQLETVWQEFSSRNTGENWQRSDKTRSMGGQNTDNKLYSQPISLYLAYNMQPRLIYLPPPLFALCQPLWRCTFCQDHNLWQ